MPFDDAQSLHLDHGPLSPGRSILDRALCPDGDLLGVGEWWIKDLSSHWIDVCTSLIEHYGPIFDQHLQGALSHIRIRCTATDSGAMVVLYAHGYLTAAIH